MSVLKKQAEENEHGQKAQEGPLTNPPAEYVNP